MHVHGRPRPVRRAEPRDGPGPREGVRRRDRTAGRLPRAARPRGPGGAAVRRVPHLDRRQDVLQHDAARARGHRHAARAGDGPRRREHLGRRLDVQGQRHRALLPLRPAGQPQPARLQAVAGRRLRQRARRARGDERVPDRARSPLPRQRREGLQHRREHLGRDARGQAARVARTSHGHRRADHGRRPLEAGGRDRRGGDHAHLRGGLADRDQRPDVRPASSSS